MRRQSRPFTQAMLFGLLAIGIAFGASIHRPAAHKADGRMPVRTLTATERVGGAPGEKGATYHWLEQQTTKVTVRFADATATSERVIGGDIHTRLTDVSGAEVATLHVNHADVATTVLNYRTPAGGSLRAVNDPKGQPTLDWAARQTYNLFKDGVAASDDRLEWQDGVIRRAGAARREFDRDVHEIRTDWAKGLSARVSRGPVGRSLYYKGRLVEGEAVTTRLTLDGLDVGTSSWYPALQILTWDLPGLSKGFIAPEHLRTQYGGWPFAPDMTWMNLQTIAFHYFKTEIQRVGDVASATPSNRLVQFFAPTLHADEPGCDGLHWLDGSILRYCCDMHDACYSKSGCTATSWWLFWSSWTCTTCNMTAIACFGGGIKGPFSPMP